MHSHLSPKDLALVIGVSESSLKRWVDEGRLTATRTVGGHRRIAIHEAVRFIRETAATVVRPELLGMSDLTSTPVSTVAHGAGEAALLSALQAGNSEQARGIIIAQCLGSRSVASVADGPIMYAMHRIGDLWRHSDHGVAVEHRAVTICCEAIHQLRMMLPPPPANAPVAVGGSLASDPYILPTLLAATCFLEVGVRDINLGADTPARVILDAAREHRASFIWVSISTRSPQVDLKAELTQLAIGAADLGASLLVGGRGVYGADIPPLKGMFIVHSMSELAAFARAALSLKKAGEHTSPPSPVTATTNSVPAVRRVQASANSAR